MMRHEPEAIHFMKNILEEVDYEIAENPTQSGWSWSVGAATCQATLPTMDEVVIDAWASAADYVRDMLGRHIPQEKWLAQWDAMSLGQQGRLVLLSFEDEEGAMLGDGLFQAIHENDLLKRTLSTLGDSIENGDTTTTQITWQQAKAVYQLSATT